MNLQVVHRVECYSKMDRQETRGVKTGRGVRQGYYLSLILFDLYSEYCTKEALAGFGDFKVRVQVICTLQHADDLVRLAKKKQCCRASLKDLFKLEDVVEWK